MILPEKQKCPRDHGHHPQGDLQGKYFLPAVDKVRDHIDEQYLDTDQRGYYIRLAAVDRPGTAATIARRMAEANISLESIMQRGRDRRPHGGEDPRSVDKPAPVALITYATTEDAVRRALAAIEQDGVVAEKPQVIRIEKGLRGDR